MSFLFSLFLVKKEKEAEEEKEKERLLKEKAEKEMERCWGCGKSFKNIGAHATRTTNYRCIEAYPEYQKKIEYEPDIPVSMVSHVVGNIRIPPPEPEPIEYEAPSGSGYVDQDDSASSYEGSSEEDYEEDEDEDEKSDDDEPEPAIMPISMVAHVVGNYKIPSKPSLPKKVKIKVEEGEPSGSGKNGFNKKSKKQKEKKKRSVWQCEAVDDFLQYCCPDCDVFTDRKKDFTKHALKEHPRSAKALGKLVVAEEMYHQDEIYVPNEEKISKINPWIVSSMDKFLHYVCPESGKCFKSKKKFVKHAITNYPVASRFLGELIIKEEIFDEIIDNDVEDYSGSGSGSSSGSSDDESSDGYDSEYDSDADDSDDEDDRRRNTVLAQF